MHMGNKLRGVLSLGAQLALELYCFRKDEGPQDGALRSTSLLEYQRRMEIIAGFDMNQG